MAGEQTDPEFGPPSRAELQYTLTNQTEFSRNRNEFVFIQIHAVRELVWIILCLISAVTCTLNSVTIALFVKSKRHAKYSDYFILNLALADLSVGAIAMPIHIVSLIVGKWNCLVVLASTNFCTTVSMFALLLITVDRYLISVWPHFYRNEKTKILFWFMFFSPWVLVSLVIVLPFSSFTLFVVPVQRQYCYYICLSTVGKNVLLIIIFVMLVPIIGVPILNIKIYQSAKHRFKEAKAQGVASPTYNSFGRISISVTASPGPTTSIATRYRGIRPGPSRILPRFECFGDTSGKGIAVESAIAETGESNTWNSPSAIDRGVRDSSAGSGNRMGGTTPKKFSIGECVSEEANLEQPIISPVRKRSASFDGYAMLCVGHTPKGFQPLQVARTEKLRRSTRTSLNSTLSGFRRLSMMSVDPDSQSQVRRKPSKRFCMTLLRLVIVFLIVCTPYTSLTIVHAAITFRAGAQGGGSSTVNNNKCQEVVTVDQNMLFFFVWFLMVNSTINPWLYPRKHSYFRNAVSEIKGSRRMRSLTTTMRLSVSRVHPASA